MNLEINELLESASADVREVDFAEGAWTGAHRRRSRRTALVGVAAASVVAVAIAVGTNGLGTRNTAPPTNPRPSSTQTLTTEVWRTAADGTKYVVAPPLGTESTLPPLAPGGLEPIDPTAPLQKLSGVFPNDGAASGPSILAMFLKSNSTDYVNATSFEPVYVLDDGRLVGSGLHLGWVRDSGGNRSVPLSADAMQFTTTAAFPQPGKVIVLSLKTGKTKTVPVPSQSIERVRWSNVGTVVASGDEGAWQIKTDAPSPVAARLPKGYTGARDTITFDSSRGTLLTSWTLDGRRSDESPMSATVSETTGQTLSSSLMAATAVVLYNGLPADSAYQGILAVPVRDPTAPRVLVMGESPPRQKGCCQVAGFLDERTPLYTDVTAEGVWLLAWNTETGDVRRAFLLKADPTVPPALSVPSFA